MNSDAPGKQWQARVEVLEGLVSGAVGITDGCRKVVALGHALDESSNELFLPFVGVDSETDRFPLGGVRERWAAAALAREDKERLATEENYRSFIKDACEKLLSVARRHAL